MLSENSCIGDTEAAMDGREEAAAGMLSENSCMGTRQVALMDKAAAAMLSGMPIHRQTHWYSFIKACRLDG